MFPMLKLTLVTHSGHPHGSSGCSLSAHTQCTLVLTWHTRCSFCTLCTSSAHSRHSIHLAHTPVSTRPLHTPCSLCSSLWRLSDCNVTCAITLLFVLWQGKRIAGAVFMVIGSWCLIGTEPGQTTPSAPSSSGQRFGTER